MSTEDPFAWRITKKPDSRSADITLGHMYADLSGPELTAVTRAIGEGLIQIGTELLQSRVRSDEDDYEDEEEW